MTRRGVIDELRERCRERMHYCRTCGQPMEPGLRKCAAQIGVSPAALSRFMRGKQPSGPMVDKLAMWLGIKWAKP